MATIDAKLADVMKMMGVPIPPGTRISEQTDRPDAAALGGVTKSTALGSSQRNDARARGARHANVLAPPLTTSTASAGFESGGVERSAEAWPSADLGGHGRGRE